MNPTLKTMLLMTPVLLAAPLLADTAPATQPSTQPATLAQSNPPLMINIADGISPQNAAYLLDLPQLPANNHNPDDFLVVRQGWNKEQPWIVNVGGVRH